MLEPTRKRPTERVVIHLLAPADQKDAILREAMARGAVEARDGAESDSLPWREAFPELTDEQMGSKALRGARGKEGLTQKELAKLTGIPQSHISAMENGKTPIGKERAKKLAEALNVNYRIFL